MKQLFTTVLVFLIGTLAVSAADLRLVDPTERYPHGVFGARFEFAAIEGDCGKMTLPDHEVFEDRRLLAVQPTGTDEPIRERAPSVLMLTWAKLWDNVMTNTKSVRIIL